jgi:NAD(P)-dependent dehydrogenase (short-subunit alcohol dehydrogenase family)
MRFADRRIIVTGGGSGIGRVISLRFAAEGASIVVADRIGARAEQVAEGINAAGGKAMFTQTDVSVSSEVDAMVTAAEEVFGGVDVLVNNAALCEGDNLVLMEEATWDLDVDATLKSVFLCSKRVLPGMIGQRRGVILNIASANGLSYFGEEAYSAAKAGVINLTRSLAVRYGQQGIRANAIAPGTIRTPIWEKQLSKAPELFERLAKWYPLGRIGEPEDVAHAALFLASDEASWITGTVLRVDGGLLAGNNVLAHELVAEFQEQET